MSTDYKDDMLISLGKSLHQSKQARSILAKKVSELEEALYASVEYGNQQRWLKESEEDVVASLKDELQIAHSRIKELEQQLSDSGLHSHPEEHA